MKGTKGPTPAPNCPNCHGTGVDLGDMGGLAHVVQACRCVKGGTSEERELWAVERVLGWRAKQSASPWRDVATDPPAHGVAIMGLWADGMVQSVKRIEVGNFRRWRFTHGDDPWASPPAYWMPIPEVPK